MRLKLQQELVHDAQNNGLVERLEAHHGIEPVAELRRKQALDVGHLVARLARIGKTDGRLVHRLGTGIGGHDDDYVAEVGLTPIVVSQRTVVHHLQQHVEDVRVRLFDLVEQQYTMRLFSDSFCQQATLVETDIARRCAYQTAHGMALHILGHVEPKQFDAHDVGQLFRCFGLADASGARKQEAPDRLVVLAQARARHLDAGRQHIKRLVLAKHNTLEISLQRFQLAAIIVGYVRGWYASDLRDNFFDLGFGNRFFAFIGRQNALRSAGFVDHVNSLVWQVAVVDVLRAQFSRCLQCCHCVLDAVMLFKARLQSLENLNSFLHSGLDHIDLLKASRKCCVFFEDAAVLSERGRPDALELTRAQGRLQQIRRIERAARSSTGANQRVNLINKQNSVWLVFQRFQHALQSLLEVAPVFGAGQQRAHV